MATSIEGSLEIGRRIRDLRERKGITQKDFAGLLDVTQGRVSQIERGAAIPEEMLPVLCSIFKVDKEYILTGKSDDGVGREYLDSGKNYRNAVDFVLWNYNYKKVNHPVPIASNMKLDNANPDYKAISKILRKNDCILTVHTRAIIDDDCVNGTGEVIYPAIVYTFALRCVALSRGYNWEAFEVDRKLKNTEDTYSDIDCNGVSQRAKVYPDEVEFVPYHFKMFTPVLAVSEYHNKRDSKSYVATDEKFWRYRTASEKAKALNHFIPRDVNDDYFIDKECPKTIRYNSDGSIDWDGEYCRFVDMINSGVNGKTLSASTEFVSRGMKNTDTVVFSGKEHDLNAFGRIGITADMNGNTEFLIDDRKISPEQLLNLLKMYDGWTIKFAIDSI